MSTKNEHEHDDDYSFCFNCAIILASLVFTVAFFAFGVVQAVTI